jgi:hypothetical protein
MGAPLSRELCTFPVLMPLFRLSMRSAVVHSCSSSRRTPDPLSAGLFRNAHHSGSLPAQLAVVWALRLHGEPGGPTSITGTARFVLAIFYIASLSFQDTLHSDGSGVSRSLLSRWDRRQNAYAYRRFERNPDRPLSRLCHRACPSGALSKQETH